MLNPVKRACSSAWRTKSTADPGSLKAGSTVRDKTQRTSAGTSPAQNGTEG